MSWLIGNLMWVLVLGAVVLGLVFLLNKKTGGTILTVVSASTGRFGRWLRETFPVYILQHEINKSCTDVDNLWDAMEKKKAIILGLEAKIPDKDREVNRLKKMIEQAVNNNDDATARSMILDRKRIEMEIIEDSNNLTRYKNEYNSMKAKLGRYEEKITKSKEEARRKEVDLNTAKADAQINKKLSRLNNLDDTGLNAANDALDRALQNAKAAAEVTNERNEKENKMVQYEQNALQAEADEELRAMKEKAKS